MIQPDAIPTEDEQRQELERDMAQIEQLVLHPAWEVVQRRVGYGIETYMELLLTSTLSLEQTQAYRERVLAYRELLKLPQLILKQFEEMKRNTAPAESAADGDNSTEP